MVDVPRRPGAYSTSRQDALRGPTPQPPSSGAHLERAVPAGIDKATAAYLEGVIVEQVAILASSLERANALKVESKALAEMSGQLLEVEESAKKEKRRGDRNKAIAWGNAAALLGALTVFVVKWTAYTDTATVASQAAAQTAVEVVEQKSLPIEVKATASDLRITALEERADAQGLELKHVRGTTDRILELLEPATEVRVPQNRRKLR